MGVNPFATIAALAERSVELAAQKYGIEIDYETKNGKNRIYLLEECKELTYLKGNLDLFGKPKHSQPREPKMEEIASIMTEAGTGGDDTIGFSEVMSGYIHAGGEVDDFDVAAKYALSRCESARFFLTVKSWDTDERE